MASRCIGRDSLIPNSPGGAIDRQSSDFRIMNRIWVGTVDDIDKTYVELKAKKTGCLAPLKKINSPNGAVIGVVCSRIRAERSMN
jgi:hypothetical protein